MPYFLGYAVIVSLAELCYDWLARFFILLLLALALLEWILRTTPNIVKEWKGRTFGCTSSFMASLGTNNADYVVGR